MSYRTYTYFTEHILVLQILYEAYSRISDTEVPVGTTGLILNLPIWEYP